MATRSALAGAAAAAVVVAALGNPAAASAARDLDDQALRTTLTRFAGWDVADQPADVVVSVAVRLGTTLVLVALLCALAGRAGSRPAAFLGGWGAAVVAAAVGGALAYVHQVAVVLDGHTLDATYLDGLVLAANAGAAFGAWTGWLVGGAVALAARAAGMGVPGAGPAGADVGHRWTPPVSTLPTVPAAPAAPTAPTPAARLAEPPPPWWAPTRDAGDHIVPGPTAFPPGGLGRHPATTPVEPWLGEPGEAGPGTPVELSTASGDPHPSDPDGTRPAGLPPQPAPQADAGATRVTPAGDERDADATNGLAADTGAGNETEGDETLPMPRQQD